MPTVYEHAGGYEALHRFIDVFYSSCLADPLLKPLFGEGQPTHVPTLTDFEAEVFGGPDDFTRKHGGFQHIIDVHRGLHITEEQRRRFIDLYLTAAEKAGLPTDAPFREALRTHVEFGTEVAMQNSHAETDADLHPLRTMPLWQWPEGQGE
ncbi:group II truncated hemoglobin [Streptomyces boninensis]|uniref:group II truncated hemoglobin n=1 Tax=Streptomyces boninensis TaxID=2039455 RepID=UPI003B2244AA